ncbi:MAG: LysM peptidoglycan-binding domain-containing protein [Caldilineaceae bacterium]|nr:LysM peptidoglycan-binding domain-containing protein [Caldilineaceae bacterium]
MPWRHSYPWVRIIIGVMVAALMVSAVLPAAAYAQGSDDASTFIRPVPPQAISYTVRRGDTLNSIARQHSVTVADILSINPQITNPNRLAVGQQIWIPVAAPQPQPPAQRPPSPRPPFSPPIAGDPNADFMYTQIFLIALGDNGAIGSPAGCGDSAVAVWVEAAPSQAILRTSLETLLNMGGPFHARTGFYNALHRSRLALSNLQLENGVATINLSGQLVADTYCEQSQVRAQLTQTALQFSTVNRVDIFVNGRRF